MSRRLVLCIDGTNNEPLAGRTNVQRLYRMLARTPTQLTYYQPGVGTIAPYGVLGGLRRRALMVLDSVSAWMLQRHVCATYRYLMSHYEDGDEIAIFGFSRGAYAARVLAGMLHKVGLLHEGMDEMVAFAWKTYAEAPIGEASNRFRKTYARRFGNIRFLGLWDTVSAVGTPWKPRTFHYTFGNPIVESVRHAVALDERRAMFVQNLWTHDAVDGQDLKEVWFAGAHSDVGGGYPDDEAGLSLIALAWMLREAQAAGIAIDDDAVEPFLGAAPVAPQTRVGALVARHHADVQHDELARHRWWRVVEYLPLPRWRPDAAGVWYRRFRCHRERARTVAPTATIHRSVEARIASGHAAPENLPPLPTYAD
jgi:uncharacterized protein (DUF2235 family)